MIRYAVSVLARLVLHLLLGRRDTTTYRMMAAPVPPDVQA